MKPYQALHQELKRTLIDQGLTYSNEREWAGEPTNMREVSVDAMLHILLDHMIGAGYVQTN